MIKAISISNSFIIGIIGKSISIYKKRVWGRDAILDQRSLGEVGNRVFISFSKKPNPVYPVIQSKNYHAYPACPPKSRIFGTKGDYPV